MFYDKQNEKRIAKGKDAIKRKLISQTLEIGTNVRFQTGLPRTPFDLEASALVDNWSRNRQAVIDYSLLNTERGPVSFGVDVRIDYKWFFPKWSLDLYLDLQGIPGLSSGEISCIREEDADGNPIINNPGTPNASYQLRGLEDGPGTITPTIGIVVQY